MHSWFAAARRIATAPRVLALSLLLFAGTFVLRLAHTDVADADEVLFVVPVAVLALGFGFRGGLGAATAASGLVVAWDLHVGAQIGLVGYVSRCVAFFVLGGLLGVVVDQRTRLENELRDNAALLEVKVAERTRELEEARAEVLKRLALAAEYRDDDTFHHTERVGATAVAIARQLGMDRAELALLRDAAPLHDIGKLAIPDAILLKPGRFTAAERKLMESHTEAGARMLYGSSAPVLQMAAVVAATHHERWDGTGYPVGLAGTAIPLVGRVVAVADVFDALTHERPYKAAWPTDEALAELKRCAGSQFDPTVVDAFLACQDQPLRSQRQMHSPTAV
jgi:putative nucleotidyltransferase with HDIG domain